jgi:hypothetical protein
MNAVIFPVRSAAWLASFGLLGLPTVIVNFDKATPGQTPPGWSFLTNQGVAAKWEIRQDTTAPTPPYVFAQVSSDTNNWRYPLAILDQPVFTNGEISVRFKPVAGKEDQAGGLIWRFRGPNDYYVVRANALENNVALYRVADGHWKPLHPKGLAGNGHAVPHSVPSNSWSILKVTFKGPLFGVYFNHRRIFQVEDKSFQSAGKVGLWTKADSVTYFDDFRVAEK